MSERSATAQEPPSGKAGETVDLGRGNFSLDGKVDAGADKVLLTSYTAIPDANRPATRLTGAGELDFGKTASFNTVISGGVIALPPRDVTKELTDPPYELVRLLGETPLPPVPPIPGKIGLDISQLDLRAVSLRNVRLDAESDGKAWAVQSLSASLPGGAVVGLTGTLTASGGRPVFAGDLSISAQQLDRFVSLYRKLPPDDPLLDTQGSLSADVALSGDTLALTSGRLVVGDVNQPFTAEIGFGTQRSLTLETHLTALDADQSAAFAALLPDIASNGSFGATFPKGDISLSADKAVVFGLDGAALAADASWDGGVLTFTKLSAGDLGGLSFDGSLTAFGTLLKPQLSGTGTLKVVENAPALSQALGAAGAPQAVVDLLKRSLPATLTLKLDAPTGDGAQSLTAAGTLASSDATATAKFASGVVAALTAPISATLKLSSSSPHLLVAQLGLGDAPLFDETTPLELTASVSGAPSSSYATQLSLTGGKDRVGFTGSVAPGDFTSVTGSGDLDLALSDPSALAGALGVDGIYVPPLTGKASLSFDGAGKLALTKIAAGDVTGALSLSRHDNKTTIGGSLALPAFDVKELLPYIVGVSGTLNAPDSLWPDGPIDLGSTARTSEGRIDLSSPSLSIGGTTLADAAFGFDWDAQSIHLRNLNGKFGGGTGTLDVTLCCAGTTVSDKQVSGRLALDERRHRSRRAAGHLGFAQGQAAVVRSLHRHRGLTLRSNRCDDRQRQLHHRRFLGGAFRSRPVQGAGLASRHPQRGTRCLERLRDRSARRRAVRGAVRHGHIYDRRWHGTEPRPDDRRRGCEALRQRDAGAADAHGRWSLYPVTDDGARRRKPGRCQQCGSCRDLLRPAVGANRQLRRRLARRGHEDQGERGRACPSRAAQGRGRRAGEGRRRRGREHFVRAGGIRSLRLVGLRSSR